MAKPKDLEPQPPPQQSWDEVISDASMAWKWAQSFTKIVDAAVRARDAEDTVRRAERARVDIDQYITDVRAEAETLKAEIAEQRTAWDTEKASTTAKLDEARLALAEALNSREQIQKAAADIEKATQQRIADAIAQAEKNAKTRAQALDAEYAAQRQMLGAEIADLTQQKLLLQQQIQSITDTLGALAPRG